MTLPPSFAHYLCVPGAPNTLPGTPAGRSMVFNNPAFTPFGASFAGNASASVNSTSLSELNVAQNGVSIAMAVQLPEDMQNRNPLLSFTDFNDSTLTFSLVRTQNGLFMQVDFDALSVTRTSNTNMTPLLGTRFPLTLTFNPESRTATVFANGELVLSTNLPEPLPAPTSPYRVTLATDAYDNDHFNGLQVGQFQIHNGLADLVELKASAMQMHKQASERAQKGPNGANADAFDLAMKVQALLVQYNPTTGTFEPLSASTSGAADPNLETIKNLLDQLVGTYGIDALFGTLATYDNRFQIYQQDFGTKEDAAAGTDTGNASLIALIKRSLQRMTTLLTTLPTSLGQKASANSVPVVLPSDQTVNTTNPNIGNTTDAAAPDDTSNVSLIARLKRISTQTTTILGRLWPALGQNTSANSVPVVLPNDQTVNTTNPNIGITTDAAAGTDTANASLIALFKRGLQRMTTLLSVLPTSLGQKASANSVPVVLPSDQTVNTANRAVTITARAPQRITSVSTAGTTSLAVPGSTTHCTVQAQGTRIYYRLDGTAAAITDQYIEAGGYLSIQGTHMTSARFCSESGAGIIAVNYWQETP